MKKIITVLGGSGYVGKHCIYRLLKTTDSTIISISRSGKIDLSEYKDLSKADKDRIQAIKGSALNKNDIQDSLLKSNAIIHSIGTLLSLHDSNNDLSYNKLSYETARIASEILKSTTNTVNTGNSGKEGNKINFVYISAERGLPFPLSIKFGGYIESKRKAESELLKNDSINTFILRPGVIVDKTQRAWSVPLGLGVNIINGIESKLNLGSLGEALQLPSQATQLDVLAKYAVDGCNGNLNKKVYSAKDLI